jgi:hypothetical protein
MSSNLTIHRAAQEGMHTPLAHNSSSHSGQPGLIRSLLADNPKLINAKDEVCLVFLPFPCQFR